ncbi:MAG: hypothetical protein AAGF56_11790, partial [Pseudomonadota bacterium]
HLKRRSDDSIVRADGQRLAVQDHLGWQGADRFQVLGRKDDVIQIGGVNVSPQYVEQVLKSLSQVRDAAVRAENARLSAFIVLKRNDATTEDHVRAAIISRLDPAARPATMTFGPEIPRDAMGKRVNWGPNAGSREDYDITSRAVAP